MASFCRNPAILRHFVYMHGVNCRHIHSSKFLLNQATEQSKFDSIFENKHVQKWMNAYEEAVGLTEVKVAQDRVYEVH